MSALGEEIRALIADEGPITVERYMALCLGHPVHGYYITRDPFGTAGDFTTAPEISQMFGELIGLWAAQVWMDMGAPDRLRLVEIGPGRGTLMRDALRAARVLPDLARAIDLHLVETSPALRARQAQALAEHAPAWHDHADGVPPGPAIVIANEFFDALPVRQFVRGRAGWHERLVGLDDEGALAFGLAPEPSAGIAADAPEGTVVEVPAAAAVTAERLSARLAVQGGALLAIDYGFTGPGFGDTLQAVRRHAYADPLADPGEADLTTQVNFSALARAGAAGGCAVHGPTTQGALLRALGIEARAEKLKRAATPAQAAAIDAALARLTGPGPAGMGELFKALAFAHPALPPPPGFQAA